MTLKKLIWTDGLFVTQHHFQLFDRYHEELLDERLRAITPYSWGIQNVSIDERALGDGQIKFTGFSAVLPDGTIIRFLDSDGDFLPSRSNIAGLFPAHVERLPIYVGVTRVRENAANVGSEAKGVVAARFSEQSARITDFNTGTDEHNFQWARPILRVLIGDESRDGFDSIPVAELVRQAGGGLALNPTYIPPVLELRASPYLMDGFRRLLSAMTARQRGLMLSRRQRTLAAVEFEASDAASYWLLDAINQYIPVFSHFIDQGMAHPEQAYLRLAELIGRLCTMAVDGDPTKIPKFNYLALRDAFAPMFQRALELIETVIPGRYTQIPLQKRDDGMVLGQVQDANVLRQDWFLVAFGGLPDTQLRDKLPRLMKIAAWEQIGPLLNSAVNGVRLEVEHHPPSALPVRPGIVFFRLQRTPVFWPEIQRTGTVALFLPLRESVELSLYAVEVQPQ
jgi:type VI secretion system protein ImpJ